MWQWLSQLQGAQSSLVGSFAGFVFGAFALILGALINFSLNRKRDSLLRADEAKAVAVALYSEIILMRAALARVANIVARRVSSNTEFDKHFLDHVRMPDPILFKTFASKLGIIDPQLSVDITSFYSKLELVRDWLPDLVESEERKFSYSPLQVLEPAIEAIDGVEATLVAIADKMGCAPPPDVPNTVLARDIVEFERMRFE